MTAETDGVPHEGWYLLAFTRELSEELTPLRIGARALVAVRRGERIKVFDATCPHRGAHLGYGGRLDGDCVVCPFHGKRIALGERDGRWSVAEHRTLVAGEAVFVRLSDAPGGDRGFEQAIKEIAAGHLVTGAVIRPLRVPSAMVVENAFDVTHFHTVHLVPKVLGMRIGESESGELPIEGEFRTKAPAWEGSGGTPDSGFASRFRARAYSPDVVVTELGAQVVITGAVPVAGGGCVARVAVGVPPEQAAALPALSHGAGYAFDQDQLVWDHLDLAAPQRFDAGDAAVLRFRRFCAEFGVTGDV